MTLAVNAFLSFSILVGIFSGIEYFLQFFPQPDNERSQQSTQEEEWEVPSLEVFRDGPIYFVKGKRIETIYAGKLDNIRWRSFAEGRIEATKTKKPIVLLFVIDVCPWCEKLELGIRKDERLHDFLTKNFIPIRANGYDEKQLTNALRVQAFPTFYISDFDGKILGNVTGYQNPEAMLNTLNRVHHQLNLRKFSIIP